MQLMSKYDRVFECDQYPRAGDLFECNSAQRQYRVLVVAVAATTAYMQ